MKTALAAFVGIPNTDDVSQQAQTTSEWNAFANAMGQAPSYMLTYLDDSHPVSQWASDTQWDIASWQASPWLKGVSPILSMPMTISSDNADTDFKAIASGAWDSTIKTVLNDWISAGYTSIYLRPGWEMNGDWMSWSITSSNAADFNAAFQHIASVAHSMSGASIQMVWSPNEGNYNATPVASYYPGNAAVDVIAIDTYGMPVDSDSTPSTAASGPSDFTLQTALAMAKADSKPIALGEAGGTDSTFPANLASVLAASGVPVAFAALWDANMSGGDLRWASNPSVAAAWKSAFQKISDATARLGGMTPTPTAVPTPVPTPGPTLTPAPTSTLTPTGQQDKLTLRVSEDAYKGDAQFKVYVDNKAVGGTYTASALHASGDSNTFTLAGNWGSGAHDVRIQFLNDAYAGTAATDRNLYVDAIAYDGKTYANTTAALMSNGARDFTIGSGATQTAPANLLTLHLAEDAYNGDAKFTLSINGKTVTTPQAVTASHAAGQWQDFVYAANLGAGLNTVGVTFTNDAWGGTASTDRNLYVNGLELNGTHYGVPTTIWSNNTVNFTVGH